MRTVTFIERVSEGYGAEEAFRSLDLKIDGLEKDGLEVVSVSDMYCSLIPRSGKKSEVRGIEWSRRPETSPAIVRTVCFK